MGSRQVVRRVVHYSGHVQGVGFRYTARRIAQNHEVTGYVRNLPDGRVELVAEGTRSHVDGFLDHVQSAMHSYISETITDDLDPSGGLEGFSIHF
jgi:acylphosphatase